MGSPKRYRGVSPSEGGRHRSHVHHEGTAYDLGRWSTAEEAAIARDRAILFLGLDRPLQVPRTARKLGPLSPAELKRRARNLNVKPTSRYLGVTLIKGRWVAQITVGYQNINVHSFDTEEEAAMARDRMVLFYRGTGHELNLPKLLPKPTSAEELRAEVVAAKPRDSEYRGVFLHAGGTPRPWQASLHAPSGKSAFCGMWETEEEAAIAHDRAVKHYGLDRGLLNFPARRFRQASPKALRAESTVKRKKNTSSKYLGVYWCKGVWCAAIGVGRQTKYLGRFASEEDAARARDEYAIKIGVGRRQLNFPPEDRLPQQSNGGQWPV